MIQVFRSLDDVNISASACAMGMFDGVHIGHRMVLDHALRASHVEDARSVVFTFANHPQSVVSQTPTPLLSTLDERLAIFEQMGFDAALVLDFTVALKNTPAEAFVEQILMGALHVTSVSVGYDHRFGKDRRGDGAFLQASGERQGFGVTIVEPVTVGDQIVSSTLIRKLLSYGDLEKANQLLGRSYSVTGTVERGVGRGRTIGFPTANIMLADERLMPAQGVYACRVSLDNDSTLRPAMANIGVAPTFGDQTQARLEVHLMDFTADLYDRTMTIHFEHHLRSEQTFPSVEALIAQLHTDEQAARHVLKLSQ